MGTALQLRLKQDRFSDEYEEAMLNLFVAVSHLWTKLEEKTADFGITHTQYNVLRILRGASHEGQSRKEIETRMIERGSDVTRLLDRLENSGLVVRSKGEADRRCSVATITHAGLDLLERIQPFVNEQIHSLSAVLTLDECLQISAVCEKIYDN